MLSKDRATTLDALRSNTELTDRLVSNYTHKEFIGQVDDSGFKIISSEIGRGAVCVFVGHFQDSTGEIKIGMHTAFKVLFSILMLMPIIGFALAIIARGVGDAVGIAIPMLVAILFIRFVFMELTFRFVSMTGFNKLVRIIGIKELSQNQARHKL